MNSNRANANHGKPHTGGTDHGTAARSQAGACQSKGPADENAAEGRFRATGGGYVGSFREQNRARPHRTIPRQNTDSRAGHTPDILAVRLPLPMIADRLGRPTRWMQDLARRDPRFPPADSDGRVSLAAVVYLLAVRELERQTDADFDATEADRRSDILRDMESGGPLEFVGTAGRARFEAVPLRTREEAIQEATEALQRFSALC